MQVQTQTQTMQAIVAHQYGGPEVLKLDHVPTPTPGAHEVLIRNQATAVTAAQMHIRSGKPYIGRLFMGLFKPNNPIGGTDFAGEVVEVGQEVTAFRVGDAVFGAADVDGGTYAEYMVVHEDDVVLQKPTNITFEEASAIMDGGMTAFAFLESIAQIEPGQHVLINGASGGIGTAAVQLAKHMGAEVTGVCSTKNRDLVKSLGADHVIDYTAEDFTQRGIQYDVIFDTVGKSSFKHCRSSLSAKGLYLTPVIGLSGLLAMIATSRSRGKKAIFSATGLRDKEAKKRDFEQLRELLASGHLKAVIDRTYQLPQAVEAHRYVEKGHKKGNVLLVM